MSSGANTATIPVALEDVQGDKRWINMVSINQCRKLLWTVLNQLRQCCPVSGHAIFTQLYVIPTFETNNKSPDLSRVTSFYTGYAEYYVRDIKLHSLW